MAPPAALTAASRAKRRILAPDARVEAWGPWR